MPEEKLINRPEYLEKLIKWSADTTLIKIITGVRRCGKSKLLDLFKSHLLANGTSESQIHKIDLDLLENKWLHEPTALYNHILNMVQPDKLNYVFLDEVQLVKDWQEVANSLRSKDNIDLYLIGSNAYMFSSKLGTLLGGRYIEIKMQPLSFKEFLDGLHPGESITESANLMADFNRYITQSGFPQTLKYNGDSELIEDYLLDSVYKNTITKDIIERYQLRSPEKLSEVITAIDNNAPKPADVSQEDFDAITKIRSYTNSNGFMFNAMIPVYANAKEVAKKFILYMASDEAQQIFFNETGALLPYSTAKLEKPANPTRLQQAVLDSIGKTTYISNRAPKTPIFYNTELESWHINIEGYIGTTEKADKMTAKQFWDWNYEEYSSNFDLYLSMAQQ